MVDPILTEKNDNIENMINIRSKIGRKQILKLMELFELNMHIENAKKCKTWEHNKIPIIGDLMIFKNFCVFII